MDELGANVWFLKPDVAQDFSGPFSITWKSKQNLDVTEWMLLVGTSDGDWDIISANMGDRTRTAIDISDITPLPERIYARLRYAVYDNQSEQDRWYIMLTPFEINSNVN